MGKHKKGYKAGGCSSGSGRRALKKGGRMQNLMRANEALERPPRALRARPPAPDARPPGGTCAGTLPPTDPRVRGRNKCRLSNTKSGEARARQSRQSAGSWSDLPYISKGLKDPIVTTVASAFGMVSAPVQGTCLYLPSTLVPQYPVGIRVCRD